MAVVCRLDILVDLVQDIVGQREVTVIDERCREHTTVTAVVVSHLSEG